MLINPKVVDKNHYDADDAPLTSPFMIGRNLIEQPLPFSTPESWSLIVEGTDKNGHLHRKEIYVDSMTYSTTKIGDKYGN